MSSETSPVRIVLAEDHELSRVGLLAALQRKPTVCVVGEAETGEQALRQVEATTPHMVLMDLVMPVMDGIEATQAIKTRFPETKVVVLTSHAEREYVLAAMAAGADAYCMKDIKLDRLLQVIEMVMEGASWLDPAIAKTVLQMVPSSNDPAATPAPPKDVSGTASGPLLTDREREVLTCITQGKSNKDIAADLGISIYTVKAHVCNIIQKLAVDDRTQAAVKALKEGLIRSE